MGLQPQQGIALSNVIPLTNMSTKNSNGSVPYFQMLSKDCLGFLDAIAPDRTVTHRIGMQILSDAKGLESVHYVPGMALLPIGVIAEKPCNSFNRTRLIQHIQQLSVLNGT